MAELDFWDARVNSATVNGDDLLTALGIIDIDG